MKYAYHSVKTYSTKKGSYIITHDREENFGKSETENPKGFSSGAKIIMVAYFLDKGQIKKMTPKTDDLIEDYKSFDCYVYDYDPDTGQMMGIVYDKKRKHCRLGWIKLE